MALNTSSSSFDEEDEIIAEINITPLTDIFLVLLIIFMVTAPALIQQGMKVNLPGASQKGEMVKGVTITLTEDQKIFIAGKEIQKVDLEQILKTELPKTTGKEVILNADKSLVLSEIVSIMDIARKSGAAKLAIATLTESEK